MRDHFIQRLTSLVQRDPNILLITGDLGFAVFDDFRKDYPDNFFTDSSKTICDPSCGDGQFLGECLIRRVENGIDFDKALSTILGVDIVKENVDLCRERLLCGQEHLRHIVEKNIVCADALRYHYRFDGTDPYKTTKDLHFDKLFG